MAGSNTAVVESLLQLEMPSQRNEAGVMRSKPIQLGGGEGGRPCFQSARGGVSRHYAPVLCLSAGAGTHMYPARFHWLLFVSLPCVCAGAGVGASFGW